MSEKSKKTYEIGYRKPPKASRFPKGRSGNPRGRPKKPIAPLDPGLILEAIDYEQIVILDGGKPKSLSKVEIEFRQQFAKGIKGDLTTARLLVQMAIDYFPPDENAPCKTELLTRAQADQRFGPNGEEQQGPMSRAYIFRKIAKERVRIETREGEKFMTRWEALVRMIQTLALSKCTGAGQLLHKMRKEFPGSPLPGETLIFLINEVDLRA